MYHPMDVDAFMGLQDDGCPHTPEHLPPLDSPEVWRHKGFIMQTLTWGVPRSEGMKLNFKVLAIRGKDLPKIGGL